MNHNYERFQSPRPETPEPGSRQGRRNAAPDVQLLDDDGAISEQVRSDPLKFNGVCLSVLLFLQLEICLKHIFAKYCTPPAAGLEHAGKGLVLMTPPEGAYLSEEGLDAWAKDTNGVPFSEETKEELRQFLDVTDNGDLTFKGFLQIYQLQTENDEEETWRDLSSHGFDRTLRLVSSRREELEDSNHTL
ncbi:hypothetical protein GLOTRDRAFT_35936 [Gloeophyllum trabeum ATCC 11539]|uniref:EF-hand domain-containing protein n=1 Tax=Gloeophyllum trabeum (strain ATCC 11539 / FP-39264 / Madison 617) TaxID=670483 RepID=S7RU25_GLOTA|nr:uncharacterized protein GLOTRDRAFT_35936 [Gloeophyllum trabeum ATCC 11539]EPQ58210.1 hypothetical protein GLOTRDRAFT_35936 [Gloeophyllum trabeum ATCC 11539]